MFNSPMSQNRARYLINILGLLPQQSVIDFGCGDGTFLQFLASETSIEGVGVDNNDVLIKQAQANWSKLEQQSNLNFVATDANAYLTSMKSVDTIICIGSEYIFGGYAAMLNTMRPVLKTNGKLLVGTIYWKQSPPAEYLSLMDGENPYYDLLTTVELAYQAGYLPLDIGRANDDEWDHFESQTARRYFKQDDKQDSTWQWLRGYLKWGITTMGFCFLLLEKTNKTITQ